MKVRLLILLVAIFLPTLAMADGWFSRQDKESELGRGPFTVDKLPVFEDVKFAFNRADVKPKYYGILDQSYDSLKKDPHLRVSLQGYTDSVGSDKYNMKLSKERAMKVEDYLMDRGLASHRVEVGWHGLHMPVASNATAYGRAQNRRVSVTLFKRDVSKDIPNDLDLTE